MLFEMVNMKVLVTGATGFTGRHTVPKLVQEGYDVFCFVRKSSDLSCLPLEDVNLIQGNLDDKESLIQALEGVDILVNIASLGFGHAPNIVDAAVKEEINRAIFFSTTSIFTTLDPESKEIRLRAEKRIRNSNLKYTILRPTMIYGTPRDRNISRFIRFVHKFPVFPIFGSGDYSLQPVHVDDVGEAVVNSLRSPVTIGKAYNISGGSVLTLVELVDEIANLLKKSVHKVHLPAKPFITFLKGLEIFSLPLPITSEQIQRFNEDKVFDHGRAKSDFDFSPRAFRVGLKDEIRSMGLLKE